MRTLLAGELTQAQRSDSDLYVKLEVQNGSGTWIDVGAALGTHWIINMTRGETIDSNVAAATFTIVARIGSASMMPLMSASALNVDDHGAYAPLLDIGRLVRANVATMAKGVALDVTKYREDFMGRIDEVSGAESLDDFGPITVTCSDLGAWLADLQIETADVVYGSDAGVPLETVLQTLLTNNVPAGDPVVTLVKQSPSFFAVQTFKQSAVKVLEALTAFVLDSTGEDIRYRYDASHVSQLTWFNPNRNRVSVDATFAPNQYLLRTLGVSLANVRNVIQMPFTDGVTGTSGYATSQNLGSVAKYRRRFNELPASALITTLAQAQNVTDAVANDLGGAPAEAQGDMPFFWPVQLYDRYTFQANSKQYDQDQTLTVVGISHVIQNGSGVTTLTLAGRIIGAYAAWLTRIADGSVVADSLTILRIESTEEPSGATRDFTLTVGSRVDSVIVHWRTVAITETEDTHDFSKTAVLPEDALSPQPFTPTGRLVTFSLPQPARGFLLAARFVPHFGVVEGESVPFTVDAAPPAINGIIHATKTGNLANLSIDIAFGVSDGPVTVAVVERVLGVPTTILSGLLMLAPATIDWTAYAQLANRPIPSNADSISWTVTITDVAANPWIFGPTVALPSVVNINAVPTELAGVGTVTVTITDSGGYLNPAAVDGAVTGQLSWHVITLGVVSVVPSTTVPGGGATSGVYTLNITLDPLHPIQVAGFVHYVDGSTEPFGMWTFDSDKISDVANASAVNNGTTVNVPVQFDTDTKIGAGCARYSLNGGSSWTTGTVASDFSALFTGITRTAAVQSMILQGQNAIDSAWGNQTTIQINPFTADVPSLAALYKPLTATTGQVVWACTLGVVTLAIDGGTPGTPSASPIAITLDSSTHNYAFVAMLGSQSIPVSVTVPSLSSAGVGSSLAGTFDALTNVLHATGNPGTVDFGWTQHGFAGTVAYNVYVNDVGRFGDAFYHYFATTAAGASSYTYTAGEQLTGTRSTLVDIGFFVEATLANTNGPRSATLDATYGTT